MSILRDEDVKKLLVTLSQHLKLGIAPPGSKLEGATKKYQGGERLVGQKRRHYDEEATVYVWHEKNLLNIPKKYYDVKFNVGHAAMKLSRYDERYGRNMVAEYISWGPTGEPGAGQDNPRAPAKNEKTPLGQTKQAREDGVMADHLGQIAKRDMELVLAMQFLRDANDDTREERQDFKKLAATFWWSLDEAQRERLICDYHVAPEFQNLDLLEIKAKENQKVFSGWSQQQRRMSSKDYDINPRLDALVKDPSQLGQQDIGACGFAAAIMAIAKAEGPEKLFPELIDAIWNGNKFRDLTIWNKEGTAPAMPGTIHERLLRRLHVIPPHVLRLKKDGLLDYFLLVGLELFFKSHLKAKHKKLLDEIYKNMPTDKDPRTGAEPEIVRTTTKLKDVERGTAKIDHWDAMLTKRGDFPMNRLVMEELTRHLNTTNLWTIQRVTRPIHLEQGKPAPEPKTVAMEIKRHAGILKSLRDQEQSAASVMVGVGDPKRAYDAVAKDPSYLSDKEIQQAMPFIMDRFVVHWVTKDPNTVRKYWSWGLSLSALQFQKAWQQHFPGEPNTKELCNLYVLPKKSGG